MKWLILLTVSVGLCGKELSVAEVSRALGHTLYQKMERTQIECDMERLTCAIRDVVNGKAPFMTEEECLAAISTAQDEHFSKQSRKNLEQADSFLATQAKKEGVISLQGGKLQYQILKQGNGGRVKANDTPLIRYTVRTLDGLVLGTDEESISLEQTIPGLKSGLLGMRRGEQRTLYIHPDLAYGPQGALFFPPNALLIFDIEVLGTKLP